jgi:hypothetical protein
LPLRSSDEAVPIDLKGNSSEEFLLRLLTTPWVAVGKAEGFGVEEAGDRHFDDTLDGLRPTMGHRVFDFGCTMVYDRP